MPRGAEMGGQAENLKQHVFSYGYDIPNLVNLDARRSGGIPEKLLVTETETMEPVGCDPCQEGRDTACFTLNAFLALGGLPTTPVLNSLWRHLAGSAQHEGAAECSILLRTAMDVSYELLIDGDPAKPLSKVMELYQRGDGDLILLNHPVAVRSNSRRFPVAFGIARAFVLNEEAMNADPEKIDRRSLILVKVEFKDPVTRQVVSELIPLNSLSRPRFD